ncbi:MAG: hypothetical protein QGH85_01085 [Candidatus Pacebacteria bacterium]|jgi:hypothetical protein|nr:hypothetical protein [Parcubacteria group bacterium]MDP6249427.1 hypothetical protein [Candidatus Paceibacterota bacterium]MDP7366310.1 hypothetical protein [Candidatus Paceibacterota bacterium]MDP7466199.1 hypothetical protein [Candidatus Paceibacterota bacterium]MDP7648499.1 hypothetical protein [Candidatus Paceibacterota bacterium]|tara:strand:+ start:3041 stop:3259 length:219 start_codon:yes stop_codon:yes gene_type:complete
MCTAVPEKQLEVLCGCEDSFCPLFKNLSEKEMMELEIIGYETDCFIIIDSCETGAPDISKLISERGEYTIYE